MRLNIDAWIQGQSDRSSAGSWLSCGTAVLAVLLLLPGHALAQDNSDCLTCHNDKTLTKKRAGKTVSLFLNEKRFAASIHGSLSCTSCHADLQGKELPHNETLAPVECGSCHTAEQELYKECKHGKAAEKKDPLAPHCADCHGNHEILAVKNPESPVFPLNIPLLCAKCHREGTPVQLQREVNQDHIIENYTESIHGEGLLKRGLIVAPNCASCHSPHRILPHTDARSTIARKNIAQTCTQCHAMIQAVHRKIIKGEMWMREADNLPACIDCHQPHKVRKVFYDQGMADRDCLRCHSSETLKASKDGRSLSVNVEELSGSMHLKVACSQCHTGVTPSKSRPCVSLTKKVDCTACHVEVSENYNQSTHGKLFARNDSNAPTCRECHGNHGVLGKKNPRSKTFPSNVPELCAQCHREGNKAALRYTGKQHQIIESYRESTHGKGLLKSGLLVTAMCTDCHTSHRELPSSDPSSSVNRSNIANTCGRCHHGIEEQFSQSIHAVAHSKKELPICNDCHTAHSIGRTDQVGFKLEIMQQCGRCHGDIAQTYFDTYHGKVSQLGYAKTAKCYDCHGAHTIQRVSDPRSLLSRENVVGTCQKCHPGATRRFAGYLTHATHHDPEKYPWLYWTFWGMTSLLVGTFVISGIHTLLWLPRAFQMRRERSLTGQRPEPAAAVPTQEEEKKVDGAP